MHHASERLVEALRAKGYRITQARIAVCEALSRSEEPCSIQDIASRTCADEASVYRTIDVLRKEALIEEIRVRGETTRFEIAEHHHHHVVCVSCGKVAHLPCGREPVTPQRIPGFSKIDSHDLTFYGTCTRCA